MRIFFDLEFTGLHKDTTIISIGFVTEDNEKFYAELIDYDRDQVDDWINKNVIDNLTLMKSGSWEKDGTVYFRGTKNELSDELKKWFSKFDKVEMWSDCLSYDWVLFNDIFGHAFSIPKNIYYIPFDICTLFKMKGIDPDISREEFIDWKDENKKHNSLFDAEIIKMCYEKLMKEGI